jgi:hypothetical protein
MYSMMSFSIFFELSLLSDSYSNLNLFILLILLLLHELLDVLKLLFSEFVLLFVDMFSLVVELTEMLLLKVSVIMVDKFFCEVDICCVAVLTEFILSFLLVIL